MVNKFVLPCLLGMMSLFGVTSVKTTTSKVTHNPTPIAAPRLEINREAVHDYSSEEVIPDGKLVVSATSSTLTSMGQSFSFMFSTGGQGWCDSTTTFLLAPDDEAFEEYYANFLTLTVEEREEMTEKYEKGEYEPVHFNSYVYSLSSTNAIKDIVIPRSLTRNHIFNLDVSRVGVNLVSDWSEIRSITIPSNIEEIYADSFQNVPDTMVFNVEAESAPEGWAENWSHGATVNFGYEYPEAKAEPFSKAGAAQYGDTKQNFFIGWYPKEGEQKPLVLEYKINLPDGGVSETQFFEFAPSSEKSVFDVVGYDLIGFTNSLVCDIPLNEGESIDFESLVLHNIYRAKTNEQEVSITDPDLTQGYRIVPKQGFLRVYDVKDFIHFKFTGLSTFAGYSAIDLDIDISDANVYSHLKTNYYNAHLSDIQSGKLKIRYRLTSLTLCKFRITYMDGEEKVQDVKIATPITQFKLNKQKGNKVSFLIKDSTVARGFATKDIKAVSFVGLYITVDLLGPKTTVTRSNVTTRFGYVEVMPHMDNAPLFDINMMLIIIAVVYIVLFVAGTIGLYFFLKNKYKNDEFRRMKNKPFITKALLFLFGSMVVVFDIIFIVLRGTALNNAIVVFNPADAFIIVLSVLSVIIIGYFVKYLVGVVKTEKERRRIIKLKLNEDVEDDGTN